MSLPNECAAAEPGREHFNPRFCPPRAAYLHVPFCRHRCGYCNFTLVADRDDLIDAYLRAVERELAGLESPRAVDTLYLGGGTPTHLAPPQLRRLLAIADHWLPRPAGGEFSVEANPLDVTAERCQVLRDGGVTRLSLGIQSFQSPKLTLLERDHLATDIVRAVERARADFAAVSVDLIFGTPGETVAGWVADLQQVLRLRPHHVSVYGLTWERGTSFWSRQQKGELAKCPDDLERAMYESAIERLTDAGYEHYEVSNFALPGFRCRHNEVYWTGRTYWAAGPGAARYVDGRREVNHRSTTTYIRRVLAGESPVAESEMLSPEDSARERLVFGLRRMEGIDAAVFDRETGFPVVSLGGKPLQQYLDQGWLVWDGPRLRLTREGLYVSDALWPDLL